jgi:hypothetical protein
MSAAAAPSQTVLKRLAGALAFVCTVLFLLAIEQKHAVAAWETVRAETGPAARRVADWAGRLPPAAAEEFGRLRSMVARQTASWTAPQADAADPRAATTGAPAGATPVAVHPGSLTQVRAELRFGNGDTLHTRPLRIAWGRDIYAADQTFAARLNAPADAQIELREVVASGPRRPLSPTALCGGEPAAVAALLHRGDRIDLMLFRSPAIGPRTPPTAVCGVWSFPTR